MMARDLVSENRHLYDVFADLLDPDGSELYLKPAADYLRPGATANFATLIEAARRHCKGSGAAAGGDCGVDVGAGSVGSEHHHVDAGQR
jgi:hypothetical protein